MTDIGGNNEVTFVPNKKSIELDGLKVLGNQLVPYVEEIDELQENNGEVLYLGNMGFLPPDSQHFANFINFNWGYSDSNILTDAVELDELEKIDFPNNLDSLIDYVDGFNSFTLDIIFALIETIRAHYNSEKVFFVGNDRSFERRIHVYLVHPKDEVHSL